MLFLLTAIGAIMCLVAIGQRLPDGRLLGWCGRLSLAIHAVHWIFVPFVDAPIFNYMLPLVPDASPLEPGRLAGEALGSGILPDAGLCSDPSSVSGLVLQSLVPFLWRTLCGLVAFAMITLLTLPVVRVIEKRVPWMMGKAAMRLEVSVRLSPYLKQSGIN